MSSKSQMFFSTCSGVLHHPWKKSSLPAAGTPLPSFTATTGIQHSALLTTLLSLGAKIVTPFSKQFSRVYVCADQKKLWQLLLLTA